MASFLYKCVNESGTQLEGNIEAGSMESAGDSLAQRGYIVLEIKQINTVNAQEIKFFDVFKTVPIADLILFTKQLKTLIRTGMPVISIFQIIKDQVENDVLKKVLDTMIEDLNAGVTLHGAFSKHPRVFSPLYCSMVKAGEVSGSLSPVLDRLTYIIEHENKIKHDIKSAMRYPVTVIAFLGIAFLVLLTLVIPTFAELFVNAGVELPMPTKISILMYEFLTDYWYISLALTVGGGVSLYLYLRTDEGRYRRDALMLALPIVGKVLVKAANSRFASIFAILHESGVSVMDSMDILSAAIGNHAIEREFIQIKEKLEEGRGLTEPLKSSKYFTPMLVSMVAVGEKSGSLEEMLKAISSHYDEEVEYAMKGMSDAIAPIVTAGLAFMVGFFALAVFMPMWELARVIK